MFRVPLWPLNEKSSVSIGALQVEDYLLMDLHELAAGKLTALIDRSAARDLYDAVRGLSMPGLDRGRLRTALVVYAGMNPHNLAEAAPETLNVTAEEVADRLTPLLRRGEVGSSPPEVRAYTERLLAECKEQLKTLLPFQPNEKQFPSLLVDEHEIRPGLLTEDQELVSRIRQQPMLLWRMQSSRKKWWAKVLQGLDRSQTGLFLRGKIYCLQRTATMQRRRNKRNSKPATYQVAGFWSARDTLGHRFGNPSQQFLHRM